MWVDKDLQLVRLWRKPVRQKWRAGFFMFEKIFLDPSVEHLPKTQMILKKLEGIPVERVTDKSQIKSPTDHTHAKKQLYLTRLSGAHLRPCQGMGDDLCCNYHTVALVSDCHLDCTYCILQDYLQNNPVITVHTNIEEILAGVEEMISVRAYGHTPLLHSLLCP